MATLFEKMWHGDVPSLPVFQSEKLGIMAILANPQETTGQLVVFPRRPAPRLEQLTPVEKNHLDFAVGGLAAYLYDRLPVDLVARHAEGYGVPDHAHWVLIPSYQRGDSDRIHHPGQRLAPEEFAERYTAVQQYLTVSEELITAEIEARRQALAEDAT